MNTSYLVYWSLLEDFFGVKNWSYPYFKWDFFYSVDFKYYEHYYPSGYIGYNSSSKYIYTRDLKKFRGFDLIDEILDKYSNKRGIPKGVLEYHLDWFIAQYPMDSDWGLVHIHYCDPLSDEIVFMICREFFVWGEEPAYPVNTPENIRLLKRYENEIKKEKNVHFLGRLGRYKYLNMDKCVEEALELFEWLKNK